MVVLSPSSLPQFPKDASQCADAGTAGTALASRRRSRRGQWDNALWEVQEVPVGGWFILFLYHQFAKFYHGLPHFMNIYIHTHFIFVYNI